MRTGFHAELDQLTAELGDMAALVGVDERSAAQVRADLTRMDQLEKAVGDRAFSLLSTPRLQLLTRIGPNWSSTAVSTS